MSRCESCDRILSTSELCRKHAETGEYLYLCNSCLREVMSIVNLPVTGDLSVIENEDDQEQTLSEM